MGSFIMYVAMMTFSPGANSFIAIENASRHGIPKAFRYTVGLFIGFVILTSLAAVASSVLYRAIPQIQPYLIVAGAIYLLYLAVGILRDKGGEQKQGKIEMCSITNGILVQFLNPQVLLCVLTAMASFVLPKTDSPLLIAGAVLMVAGIAGCAGVIWTLAGAAFQRFINRYRKQANIIMAVMLVYCAWSLVRPIL